MPVDTSGNLTSSVHTAAGVPADAVSPEEVTILSVTAGYAVADGNTLTMRWNPSVNSMGDLADQTIYLDAGAGYDAGTSLGGSATSYTRTGLDDATRYRIKITVKDALGHESAGALSEGVTRLANPAGLAADPGNGKVSLTWTKVASPYVKAYRIYRAVSDTPKTELSQMTLIFQLETQNSQLMLIRASRTGRPTSTP